MVFVKFHIVSIVLLHVCCRIWNRILFIDSVYRGRWRCCHTFTVAVSSFCMRLGCIQLYEDSITNGFCSYKMDDDKCIISRLSEKGDWETCNSPTTSKFGSSFELLRFLGFINSSNHSGEIYRETKKKKKLRSWYHKFFDVAVLLYTNWYRNSVTSWKFTLPVNVKLSRPTSIRMH